MILRSVLSSPSAGSTFSRRASTRRRGRALKARRMFSPFAALSLGCLLFATGCATHIDFWPPSVSVSWGNAEASGCEKYAVKYGDDGSVAEESWTDCPYAHGGQLSNNALRALERLPFPAAP